ncbi:MAG: FkbM family methyltransferase, partial [Gemmatimonadetes bacterium]|nr:FkbM family methyltransferase [Gemmatimonadota bacterium]
RAGTAAFTAPRGANAGVGALATDGAGSFTVQTLVLDDWLEQNGVDQLALCKMDIEGGEALALPGLARALAAHRVRALLLELHPSELPKFGSSSGAIVARLEGHGYRVRFWEPPGRFEDGPPRGDGTYLLALAPGVAWPPSLR